MVSPVIRTGRCWYLRLRWNRTLIRLASSENRLKALRLTGHCLFSLRSAMMASISSSVVLEVVSFIAAAAAGGESLYVVAAS